MVTEKFLLVNKEILGNQFNIGMTGNINIQVCYDNKYMWIVSKMSWDAATSQLRKLPANCSNCNCNCKHL